MPGPRPRRSLRFRLLAATLLAMGVALLLAGLLLAGLFRDHVMRQFGQSLTAQLDQVTARLDFDAAGQPQLDAASLSDPRWSRPYSGLYWQIDRADAAPASGVLRSRSLWDTTLQPPADALADGEVHVHEVAGPQGARLMLVERTVAPEGTAPARWRLMVAADLAGTTEAVERFNGVLAASLAVLAVLLGAAALAQVAVGLAPLRALQRALAAVHEGRAQRLDEAFPAEVQPLVDDFNRVLDRNAEIVTRARTQAGNLAHAIKTPLAALAQAASAARRAPREAAALPALVDEQVQLARRHVDWHLARSRAAAAHGLPGAQAAVQPAIAGLLRVMAHVHAERGLDMRCDAVAPGLAFAGEVQDLQEMVGNLIDNACKWARSTVHVAAWSAAGPQGPRLHIAVEDDGPGIAAERRERVLARGERLDETVPGSGLGLGIVSELAALYGGRLALGTATAGGLRAELELPGG
ncbi:MAG: sensor histidine kinase [Rubrivivax sp.]|nr:sensor histidine kinase [Rubrivivax sp.]